MQIESDRRRTFDVSPERLWDVLNELDRYPTWWPWLRRFEATALAAGETWRCEVRAPLGYPVRFDVHLSAVEEARSVAARVDGDVVGSASIVIEAELDRTVLRFTSELLPSARHLRLLGRMAPGLARSGHDAIVDAALRQFADRALPHV